MSKKPRPRGVYCCGFVPGDFVRLKHGRKRWKVVADDTLGCTTGEVLLELRDRVGAVQLMEASKLVLLRAAKS